MPTVPLITAIIPTYNNREILKKVLLALIRQQSTGIPFEVIVLDDGSEDNTRQIVKQVEKSCSIPIRYEWQQNRGVSAARNKAVTLARGKYCILLGDDIIASPDLLRNHLLAHKNQGFDRSVVIGPVNWPDGMEISPFMEWLEQTEFQFAYNHITRTEDIDFRYFYACNVSLLTESLRRNPFQEKLSYLFEDTELGCRLYENGHRFFFNPEAVGYHDHPRSFDTFEKRQFQAGRSLWTAFQINPGMKEFIPMPRRRPFRMIRAAIRGVVLPLFPSQGGWRMREKFWRGRLNLALSRGYFAARRENSRVAEPGSHRSRRYGRKIEPSF